MKRGRVACFFAVIVVTLGLTACGSGQASTKAHPTAVPVSTIAGSDGTVAATVNGAAIPMARFKAFLNSSQLHDVQDHRNYKTALTAPSVLVRQTLIGLVESELTLQYAQKHHIHVTNHAINQLIRRSASSLPAGAVRYAARLNLIGAKVRNQVTPLPKRGTVATARDILIGIGKNPCSKKTLSAAGAYRLARSLYIQIRSGASFSKLAKKCSTDTITGAHGGIVHDPISQTSTTLYPNTLIAEVNAAVFQGPVHSLQLVPQSPIGYHIVEVTSRHVAAYPLGIAENLQTVLFGKWINAQLKKAHGHYYVHAQ